MMTKPWPWNKLGPPAIGGNQLTVCISAICESENAVILASDSMISMGGYMKGDALARKLDPFFYHWFSQFAAEDISAITPIYERVEKNINRKASEITLEDVSKMARDSYKGQRQTQIEDDILSSYGTNWEEFKINGRNLFNDRDYELITEKIRSYDLNVEMLIAGFDGKNNPHIFTVGNPGKASYYDKLGFWSIGSGQHQALASLFGCCYRRYASLETCISQVLCAKFAAESAEGVGESTWLLVYTGEDQSLYLDAEIMQEIKKEWKLLPRIPASSLPIIKKWINTEKKTCESSTT